MIAKRVYTKPEIASVNLIPDEAVLSACKTAGINGPRSTGDNCRETVTVACVVEAS